MTAVVQFRNIVWVIALSLILLMNLLGAQRPFYKGVQRPVGPDLASVYVPFSDSEYEPPVPVMKWRGNNCDGGLVDTGQKVLVCLRNSYKDDRIVFYPRVTLAILIPTVLIYLVLGWLIQHSPPPSTPQGSQSLTKEH